MRQEQLQAGQQLQTAQRQLHELAGNIRSQQRQQETSSTRQLQEALLSSPFADSATLDAALLSPDKRNALRERREQLEVQQQRADALQQQAEDNEAAVAQHPGGAG